MHRYFPHRGERMNIVHNVHKDDTVEDMDKIMPMIYATLDNKQDEF
jgi:hypothetical protein